MRRQGKRAVVCASVVVAVKLVGSAMAFVVGGSDMTTKSTKMSTFSRVGSVEAHSRKHGQGRLGARSRIHTPTMVASLKVAWYALGWLCFDFVEVYKSPR